MKIEPIYKFIQDEVGVPLSDLKPNSDIYELSKIDGDDCFEFESSFAKKFSVDMSKFLWYFHHGEEGLNLGRFIIKSPNDLVNAMPITPELLLNSAKSGIWELEYPKHKIPKMRFNLILGNTVFFGMIAFIIYVFQKNT